jgi:transcriptional regulator with XRE-family HTH domain
LHLSCIEYILRMSMIAERLNSVVRVVFEGNALDAATAAGVLPSTLTRLMTGFVVAPRVTTVIQLADAFGVSFGWVIGEVSTAAAQAGEVPLAEPYWLLRQFYRRKQMADRDWLKRVGAEQGTKASREIIKYFASFQLLPDGGSDLNTALAAVVDFTKDGGPVELEIFRSLAMLETDLLAAAVVKLRHMGVRTTDDKPKRSRK